MIDPTEPDLRALWQAQPDLPLGLATADIRAKAGKLRDTIAARNNREWIAAAFVAVSFSVLAATNDRLVPRLGCTLIVAATAYVAWHLRRHGTARSVPADGLPCLAFYRRELTRQRDLLCGVWRWYLGPMLPGLGVLTIDRLLGGIDAGAILGLLFIVVVFTGIGWINHRVAGEIQRQIDALPPEEPTA